MDDFHNALLESFFTEVNTVMSDVGSIFNKNTIDNDDIQIAFRAFHNMKSNSRLLEYHGLSHASAMGEEICREILNKNVPASSTILNCLRDIYDHTSYLFECIKANKKEPAISEPEYQEIKNILYGFSSDHDKQKYSKKEMEVFSRILADNFSNSLALPENINSNEIRNAIVLIKESANLLEITTLAQHYEILGDLLEQGVSKTDKRWIDMADRIVIELKKIEAENNIEKELFCDELHR